MKVVCTTAGATYIDGQIIAEPIHRKNFVLSNLQNDNIALRYWVLITCIQSPIQCILEKNKT